ncbi:MAG: DUF5615 family PIN-like protein [Microcystaceae cyanobacterium]
MKIRFLLDENLSPKLKLAIQRANSSIEVLRVGDPDAPTFGTLDPELLQYLEISQRLLVTDNRSSMPGHLNDHWQVGGQIWGVVWLRPSSTTVQCVESIVLMWEITEAEEWINRLEWIPF